MLSVAERRNVCVELLTSLTSSLGVNISSENLEEVRVNELDVFAQFCNTVLNFANDDFNPILEERERRTVYDWDEKKVMEVTLKGLCDVLKENTQFKLLKCYQQLLKYVVGVQEACQLIPVWRRCVPVDSASLRYISHELNSSEMISGKHLVIFAVMNPGKCLSAMTVLEADCAVYQAVSKAKKIMEDALDCYSLLNSPEPILDCLIICEKNFSQGTPALPSREFVTQWLLPFSDFANNFITVKKTYDNVLMLLGGCHATKNGVTAEHFKAMLGSKLGCFCLETLTQVESILELLYANNVFGCIQKGLNKQLKDMASVIAEAYQGIKKKCETARLELSVLALLSDKDVLEYLGDGCIRENWHMYSRKLFPLWKDIVYKEDFVTAIVGINGEILPLLKEREVKATSPVSATIPRLVKAQYKTIKCLTMESFALAHDIYTGRVKFSAESLIRYPAQVAIRCLFRLWTVMIEGAIENRCLGAHEAIGSTLDLEHIGPDKVALSRPNSARSRHSRLSAPRLKRLAMDSRPSSELSSLVRERSLSASTTKSGKALSRRTSRTSTLGASSSVKSKQRASIISLRRESVKRGERGEPTPAVVTSTSLFGGCSRMRKLSMIAEDAAEGRQNQIAAPAAASAVSEQNTSLSKSSYCAAEGTSRGPIGRLEPRGRNASTLTTRSNLSTILRAQLKTLQDYIVCPRNAISEIDMGKLRLLIHAQCRFIHVWEEDISRCESTTDNFWIKEPRLYWHAERKICTFEMSYMRARLDYFFTPMNLNFDFPPEAQQVWMHAMTFGEMKTPCTLVGEIVFEALKAYNAIVGNIVRWLDCEEVLISSISDSNGDHDNCNINVNDSYESKKRRKEDLVDAVVARRATATFYHVLIHPELLSSNDQISLYNSYVFSGGKGTLILCDKALNSSKSHPYLAGLVTTICISGSSVSATRRMIEFELVGAGYLDPEGIAARLFSFVDLCRTVVGWNIPVPLLRHVIRQITRPIRYGITPATALFESFERYLLPWSPLKSFSFITSKLQATFPGKNTLITFSQLSLAIAKFAEERNLLHGEGVLEKLVTEVCYYLRQPDTRVVIVRGDAFVGKTVVCELAAAVHEKICYGSQSVTIAEPGSDIKKNLEGTSYTKKVLLEWPARKEFPPFDDQILCGNTFVNTFCNNGVDNSTSTLVAVINSDDGCTNGVIACCLLHPPLSTLISYSVISLPPYTQGVVMGLLDEFCDSLLSMASADPYCGNNVSNSAFIRILFVYLRVFLCSMEDTAVLHATCITRAFWSAASFACCPTLSDTASWSEFACRCMMLDDQEQISKSDEGKIVFPTENGEWGKGGTIDLLALFVMTDGEWKSFLECSRMRGGDGSGFSCLSWTRAQFLCNLLLRYAGEKEEIYLVGSLSNILKASLKTIVASGNEAAATGITIDGNLSISSIVAVRSLDEVPPDKIVIMISDLFYEEDLQFLSSKPFINVMQELMQSSLFSAQLKRYLFTVSNVRLMYEIIEPFHDENVVKRLIFDYFVERSSHEFVLKPLEDTLKITFDDAILFATSNSSSGNGIAAEPCGACLVPPLEAALQLSEWLGEYGGVRQSFSVSEAALVEDLIFFLQERLGQQQQCSGVRLGMQRCCFIRVDSSSSMMRGGVKRCIETALLRSGQKAEWIKKPEEFTVDVINILSVTNVVTGQDWNVLKKWLWELPLLHSTYKLIVNLTSANGFFINPSQEFVAGVESFFSECSPFAWIFTFKFRQQDAQALLCNCTQEKLTKSDATGAKAHLHNDTNNNYHNIFEKLATCLLLSAPQEITPDLLRLSIRVYEKTVVRVSARSLMDVVNATQALRVLKRLELAAMERSLISEEEREYNGPASEDLLDEEDDEEELQNEQETGEEGKDEKQQYMNIKKKRNLRMGMLCYEGPIIYKEYLEEEMRVMYLPKWDKKTGTLNNISYASAFVGSALGGTLMLTSSVGGKCRARWENGVMILNQTPQELKILFSSNKSEQTSPEEGMGVAFQKDFTPPPELTGTLYDVSGSHKEVAVVCLRLCDATTPPTMHWLRFGDVFEPSQDEREGDNMHEQPEKLFFSLGEGDSYLKEEQGAPGNYETEKDGVEEVEVNSEEEKQSKIRKKLMITSRELQELVDSLLRLQCLIGKQVDDIAIKAALLPLLGVLGYHQRHLAVIELQALANKEGNKINLENILTIETFSQVLEEAEGSLMRWYDHQKKINGLSSSKHAWEVALFLKLFSYLNVMTVVLDPLGLFYTNWTQLVCEEETDLFKQHLIIYPVSEQGGGGIDFIEQRKDIQLLSPLSDCVSFLVMNTAHTVATLSNELVQPGGVAGGHFFSVSSILTDEQQRASFSRIMEIIATKPNDLIALTEYLVSPEVQDLMEVAPKVTAKLLAAVRTAEKAMSPAATTVAGQNSAMGMLGMEDPPLLEGLRMASFVFRAYDILPRVRPSYYMPFSELLSLAKTSLNTKGKGNIVDLATQAFGESLLPRVSQEDTLLIWCSLALGWLIDSEKVSPDLFNMVMRHFRTIDPAAVAEQNAALKHQALDIFRNYTEELEKQACAAAASMKKKKVAIPASKKGKKNVEVKTLENFLSPFIQPDYPFITDEIWGRILVIDKLRPQLHLCAALQHGEISQKNSKKKLPKGSKLPRKEDLWTSWLETCIGPIPTYDSKGGVEVTPLDKLLLILAMRPDCLVGGLLQFVSDTLGFTFPDPYGKFDLLQELEKATGLGEIAESLETGKTNKLKGARTKKPKKPLSYDKIKDGKCRFLISFHSSEAAVGEIMRFAVICRAPKVTVEHACRPHKIQEALESAFKLNEWVIIDGCDMLTGDSLSARELVKMTSNLPADYHGLIFFIADIDKMRGELLREFSVIPTKFACSSDGSLKSTMERIYSHLDDIDFKTELLHVDQHRLIFTLALLVSAVELRGTYGSLGFDDASAFKYVERDTNILLTAISRYCAGSGGGRRGRVKSVNNNHELKWDAIREYATAFIGGMSSNENDRAIIKAYADWLIHPEVVMGRVEIDNDVSVPLTPDLEAHIQAIERLPGKDCTDMIGLHAGVETSVREKLAEKITLFLEANILPLRKKRRNYDDNDSINKNINNFSLNVKKTENEELLFIVSNLQDALPIWSQQMRANVARTSMVSALSYALQEEVCALMAFTTQIRQFLSPIAARYLSCLQNDNSDNNDHGQQSIFKMSSMERDILSDKFPKEWKTTKKCRGELFLNGHLSKEGEANIFLSHWFENLTNWNNTLHFWMRDGFPKKMSIGFIRNMQAFLRALIHDYSATVGALEHFVHVRFSFPLLEKGLLNQSNETNESSSGTLLLKRSRTVFASSSLPVSSLSSPSVGEYLFPIRITSLRLEGAHYDSESGYLVEPFVKIDSGSWWNNASENTRRTYPARSHLELFLSLVQDDDEENFREHFLDRKEHYHSIVNVGSGGSILFPYGPTFQRPVIPYRSSRERIFIPAMPSCYVNAAAEDAMTWRASYCWCRLRAQRTSLPHSLLSYGDEQRFAALGERELSLRKGKGGVQGNYEYYYAPLERIGLDGQREIVGEVALGSKENQHYWKLRGASLMTV